MKTLYDETQNAGQETGIHQGLQAVICEACGDKYTVKPETARRARFAHLCTHCRAVKGLLNGAHKSVTPESTKAKRIRANGLVNSRKNSGWFKPPLKCMKCAAEKRLDSHHPDYEKPDEVVWLCRSCHMKAHRDIEFLVNVPVITANDKRRHTLTGRLPAVAFGGVA